MFDTKIDYADAEGDNLPLKAAILGPSVSLENLTQNTLHGPNVYLEIRSTKKGILTYESLLVWLTATSKHCHFTLIKLIKVPIKTSQK